MALGIGPPQVIVADNPAAQITLPTFDEVSVDLDITVYNPADTPVFLTAGEDQATPYVVPGGGVRRFTDKFGEDDEAYLWSGSGPVTCAVTVDRGGAPRIETIDTARTLVQAVSISVNNDAPGAEVDNPPDTIDVTIRLLDSSGNPVSGVQLLDVRLFDDALLTTLSTISAHRGTVVGAGAVVSGDLGNHVCCVTDASGVLGFQVQDVAGGSLASIWLAVTDCGALSGHIDGAIIPIGPFN